MFADLSRQQDIRARYLPLMTGPPRGPACDRNDTNAGNTRLVTTQRILFSLMRHCAKPLRQQQPIPRRIHSVHDRFLLHKTVKVPERRLLLLIPTEEC